MFANTFKLERPLGDLVDQHHTLYGIPVVISYRSSCLKARGFFRRHYFQREHEKTSCLRAGDEWRRGTHSERESTGERIGDAMPVVRAIPLSTGRQFNFLIIATPPRSREKVGMPSLSSRGICVCSRALYAHIKANGSTRGSARLLWTQSRLISS